MFNTLDIRHQLLFFQPTKGAPASISPTTAADPSHSFRMTINVSCHSEWTQECLVGKTRGNGMVTQNEESITLMTPYRFPSLR